MIRRTILALVAVLAFVLAPGVSAQADPTVNISLTVNSLGRVTSSAELALDSTVLVSGYKGLVCQAATACTGVIEGRLASDGTVRLLASYGSYAGQPDPSTRNYVSATAIAKIDAVRFRIYGTLGESIGGWQSVADPLAGASLTLHLNSFDRSTSTGKLLVNATVVASNYRRPVAEVCQTGSSCTGVVEGRNALTGQSHLIASYGSYSGKPYPYTHTYTADVAMAKIDAIRVRLYGPHGEIATAWEPVVDVVEPSVGLEIRTLQSTSSTAVGFDLTLIGSDYAVPGAVCGSPTAFCYGKIEARRASDGVGVPLGSSSDLRTKPYPFERVYSGTVALGAFDAVRATISGANGDLTTGWIPISADGVSGSHDIGAANAIALAALGTMGPLQGCLALFPVGTHQTGTTVNDQQAACLSATQGGQSFAVFLSSYVRTLSTNQVTAMLVAAGVLASANTAAISPSLDYGQALPGGCSWSSATLITCSWTGQLVEVRPISAPPILDPIYESNFLNNATNRGTNTEPNGPTSAPLATLWVGTQGKEIWREALRTCVAHLGRIVGDTTVGDLLGVDECDGMPIFFSGGNVFEATEHDADVIAASPQLMMLSYVKDTEKGFNRPAGTSSFACGPGYDSSQVECDEYPFFTTAQGLNNLDQFPDYRLVDKSDNARQGGYYGAFTQRCPQLSLSPLGSADRNFLVVADVDLPATFGYCPL